MAHKPSSIDRQAAAGRPAWHTVPIEEAARALRVDAQSGLPAEEAAQRAVRYGANEIAVKKHRGAGRMLLSQFSDFMIIVLLAAAVISGIIGDIKDALAILVIVALNAVIGFAQEFRAERAIAALQALAATAARVLREGAVAVIPTPGVVPGDIVLLEAGNVVPADLRLIEAINLKVDEAALTGESQAAEKHIHALEQIELPLGDRSNMAYKGTVVAVGRGRGIAVATGRHTELGKIATLLAQQQEPKTPLQKRLAVFGRRLALAALAVCAIVFAAGVLRGESVVLMFLIAVSLAVAAMPEALPAIVTISLALGARNMVKKHALIRRLPAVETLGSVTFVCSDKTGTLTQNRMRVEEIFAGGSLLHDWKEGGGGKARALLFQALALCNDASRDRHGRVSGDPTEAALLLAALDAGFDKAVLERDAPRLGELPFDAARKRMTTLHRHGEGVIAFIKGAPESVVRHCRTMLAGQGEMPLREAEILAQAERMAADGLRVLAVAYRLLPALPEPAQPEKIERGLVLLGLVGMMDPPRPGVKEAVALCKSAGITPVMITGDHPLTARAIASRLGIFTEGGAVMTGAELARLPKEEFEAQARHVRVYARMDPEQKIRIVQALQDRGEFVAMTGDGVNDAPALKIADIGVAMGRGGTDVAREASSLVLLDDNFATIVAAVREGRRIYDNIRKFIKYTMTSNAGEIWAIFLAPFLGLPIPLLPIHILWINLVTDGLPGLALAAEPEERGVMKRKPRPPRESVFAHGMWQHMIWVGLLMGGVALMTQAWAYHSGSAPWQSMVFTVLTLSQMGHALAIRSEKGSLWGAGIFSNPWLLAAVLLTFVLQLAILYLPFLNSIFKTEPLEAGELVICLLLSSVVFFAVEIEKWMMRRGWLYREPEAA